VSVIAARRPPDPRPVSYLNAWWAVTQSLLTGLIILVLLGVVFVVVGFVAPLPLGEPGSSWTPIGSVAELPAWPFDPSLLWFRILDVFALVTVVLWLGRRLRDRFLVLHVRLRLADTTLAVAGMLVITAISHWAAVVAVFVVAGLLRRADIPSAERSPAVLSGRWIAVAWGVALLGSFVAVNLVPVGAQAGSSCSVGIGSLQPPPQTTYGAGARAIRYGYRRGGTFTACAVAQDRAWFANATVLGLDAGQLPAAPWRISLVRPRGAGYRPVSSVRLTPRSSRDIVALVRLTACTPAMQDRTFTLASLPLRVRAYGRTQTDPVPLSQPVWTACP
jgi:hypothetical protein